ncbi:Bro-N domain-containing protein [Castellaniella denitrificans]|uniref:BRO-N domain-containing protein n=1 Tax=Castellaniella denitrificans TaxID=56119 RepID=UPI0036106FA5
MNSLIPFDFDQHPVRAVAGDDGSAWFVGRDVAEALGYADTVNAIKQHCRGVAKHHPLPTAGGIQDVRLISEPDLYRLVVGSRLPAAERFERWVFEDVLPTIRRTGSYFAQPAAADMRGVNTAFWLIPPAVRAARSLGLQREAAIVAANRTVASLTGVDAMALLGIEAPAPEALAAPRPEAEFLLAWQHGAVVLADDADPLPFVPCTGRQLHTAYLLWFRREKRQGWPQAETQFVGFVGRQPGWVAGRPQQTYRDRAHAQRLARKMVIPANLMPPMSQTRTEWLTEGYFNFQAALGAAQSTGDQE